MCPENESGPNGGAAPAGKSPPAADASVSQQSIEVTQTIDLVQRAQTSGDQEAINRLFQRYYDRLRAIVRIRMGNQLRKYMDSEDILQETFMAALRAFDRFDVRDEASFIRWLATIALNQIRGASDYHHAMKRDRRRDLALEGVRGALSSGELQLDPIAPGPSPLGRIGVREQLQEIEGAIDELPDNQREVFVLRHFIYDSNTSWDTIAEAMGGERDGNATRVLHSRAVTKLLTVMRKRREERSGKQE